MLKKTLKTAPEKPKEELRKRIVSNTDQFFEEWPQHYSDMEKRGRKALWRSLGEAAVLVKVAQDRPEILQRITSQSKTESEDRRYQRDALVKDVVYLLMKPKEKDEITKATKYITTIRFLLSEQVEDEKEFAEVLKRMGGIESACKKARRKGFCEIKEESKLDSVADVEIAETKDDHFPKLDEEFLEKLTHVDMGVDTKKI